MKHFFITFALFIMATIFIGCAEPVFISTETDEVSETIEVTDENSENQEKALFFTQNNETEFFTDEESFLSQTGYTFWTAPFIAKIEDAPQVLQTQPSLDYAAAASNTTLLSVTAQKISGSKTAGYGILWSQNKTDWNCILLNTEAKFITGRISKGIFTATSDWKNFMALNQGFCTENIIEVSYSKESNSFCVSLNKITAATFPKNDDSNEQVHWGYAVVISPKENFPTEPVNVRFSKTL